MNYESLLEVENLLPMSPRSKELMKLIQKIKSDCSEFLQYEPSLVYRGIVKLPLLSFGKKIVRSDREPRDTDRHVHEILNDIFEEIFGYRLRQESLFATRDFDMAESYGSLGNGITAIIFPVGEYHIISSKKVTDMYTLIIEQRARKVFPREMSAATLMKKFGGDVGDVGHMTIGMIMTIGTILSKTGEKNIMVKVRDYLISILKKHIYEHYDFESDTTIDKSELMIICDSYYYIDTDFLANYAGTAYMSPRTLNKTSPQQLLIKIEKMLKSGQIK